MSVLKQTQVRAQNLILWCCALTTLAVTPFWNFDPINPVKQFILAVFSFATFGLVFNRLRDFLSIRQNWVIVVFIVSMFVPLVFVNAPISQQVWGTFGRNTGFLTYLSASLLLVSSVIVSSEEFLRKFIKFGIWTSVALTSYSLVQLFGQDPIKWSAQDTFATLGNVNFLSALLGSFSVMVFSLIFFSKKAAREKILLSGFLLVSMFIVYKTDSVQGLFVFLTASYLNLIFFLYKSQKVFQRICSAVLTISGFILTYFGFRGLLGTGPLGSLLYQNTNVFRADYMGAAWRTFQNHWITGVGFDGFDSWYRTERGFISAYRTNPSRTTNSAHNVFLDIANNGGAFLIGSYLLIVIFAAFISMKKIFKEEHDPFFLALFGFWIAHVLQSIVSINQIGVSVWGWAATGLIIGSARWKGGQESSGSQGLDNPKSRGKSPRKTSSQQLIPAGLALKSIAMASIGAVLAFMPLKADGDFQQARKAANLNQMMAASSSPAATAFQISMTLDAAMKGNYMPQALLLSDDLIKRFPREFFGWQIRLQLPGISDAERIRALEKMKELDPYYACTSQSPSKEILTWFRELPNPKKYELARWWGVVPFSEVKVPTDVTWLEQSRQAIEQHVLTFCGR